MPVVDFASEWVNWVSRDNLQFPKNRSAGAYAIHDPTISGWNDRFGADFVAKVENRTALKISPKSIFRRCHSRKVLWGQYEGQ